MSELGFGMITKIIWKTSNNTRKILQSKKSYQIQVQTIFYFFSATVSLVRLAMVSRISFTL